VKGIQNIENSGGKSLSISDIFTNSIFRNIVLSLLATLGLYIIASVIFVSAHPTSLQSFVLFMGLRLAYV